MDDVLVALGWGCRARHRLLVVGYIAALSVAFTAAGFALTLLAGDQRWIVELLLWVPWLVWLGYWFPRHHRRVSPALATHPYREAFFFQVAPGISWNFAQMARPAFAATVDGGFAHLSVGPAIVGVAIAALGAVMIAFGLRAIGVSRALFLGEYEPTSRTLVTDGIYGVVRHPLFVGGLVTSLGSAVFFASYVPLTMAAANLAVLPVYLWLEDRRCRDVHAGYEVYELDVNGVVPVSVRTRARSTELTPR